jgi:hypothetical protein
VINELSWEAGEADGCRWNYFWGGVVMGAEKGPNWVLAAAKRGRKRTKRTGGGTAEKGKKEEKFETEFLTRMVAKVRALARIKTAPRAILMEERASDLFLLFSFFRPSVPFL